MATCFGKGLELTESVSRQQFFGLNMQNHWNSPLNPAETLVVQADPDAIDDNEDRDIVRDRGRRLIC